MLRLGHCHAALAEDALHEGVVLLGVFLAEAIVHGQLSLDAGMARQLHAIGGLCGGGVDLDEGLHEQHCHGRAGEQRAARVNLADALGDSGVEPLTPNGARLLLALFACGGAIGSEAGRVRLGVEALGTGSRPLLGLLGAPDSVLDLSDVRLVLGLRAGHGCLLPVHLRER